MPPTPHTSRAVNSAAPRRSLPIRLLRAAAVLSLALALAALALWALSRHFTDELYLSQFLFWTPTWVYLAAAAVLALPGLALRPASTARPIRTLRTITAASLIIALLYAHIVEDRRFIGVFRGEPARAKLPFPFGDNKYYGEFTLLHWNMESPDTIGYTGPIPALLPHLSYPPDFIVISNYQSLEQFKDSIALWTDQRKPGYVTPYHFTAVDRFRIASMTPILSTRTLTLSPADPPRFAGSGFLRRTLQSLFNRYNADAQPEPRRFNPATNVLLVYVTLAHPTSNGRLTLCLIDLPSDPLSPRYATAQKIAAAIAAADPPLPTPDLWIGDFNTPIGSASLDLIAPVADHALHLAANPPTGHVASWPRVRPLLLLDHTLVGPQLTAVRYELLTPTVADHRAQWITLAPAANPPRPRPTSP